MGKRQARGVEEKPFYPLFRERAVQLEVAVLVVAEDRMAGVREVHADLVRTPGEQPHLEQAEAAARLRDPHPRRRRLSILPHRDASLALGGDVLMERLADLEVL